MSLINKNRTLIVSNPQMLTTALVAGLTTNTLPKATGAFQIGDSSITDDGTTVTTTSVVKISSTEPRLLFNESDQGANLKLWDFDINGGVLSIRTRTDADGAGITAWSVTRGATTALASQAWTATTSFTFNTGYVRADGKFGVGMVPVQAFDATGTGGTYAHLTNTDSNTAGLLLTGPSGLDVYVARAGTANGIITGSVNGDVTLRSNTNIGLSTNNGSTGTFITATSSGISPSTDNIYVFGDATHRWAAIYGRNFISSVDAVGVVGATSTIDVTLGEFKTLTSTASTNMTLTPSAAGTAGQVMEYQITSDATGGVVVTFANTHKSAGTMVLTASKLHIISWRSNGTNWVERYRLTGL